MINPCRQICVSELLQLIQNKCVFLRREYLPPTCLPAIALARARQAGNNGMMETADPLAGTKRSEASAKDIGFNGNSPIH
jgi:hypothetical protein